MDQRAWLFLATFLAGCSGATVVNGSSRAPSASVQARAPAPAPAIPKERDATSASPERAAATASAPLELDYAADDGQTFVENAKRAVAEYREFIERAGTDEQYAPAVKRSRERIEDLEAARIFVENGMRERAGK